MEALVKMTKQIKQKNDQDGQVIQQQPLMTAEMYAARRHMCSSRCKINCRKTFDSP